MTIQPGTPKLPEMVEKADVIVVGQIQSTNTGDISKKRDTNTFTYKITFDRVIKGFKLARSKTLSVKSVVHTIPASKDQRLLGITPRSVDDLYNEADEYLYPKKMTYGLFLLKAVRPGVFEFVNSEHPLFEIEQTASAKVTDSTDPLIGVVNQLTQFLAVPGEMLSKLHPGRPLYTSRKAIAEAANALSTVPYKLVSSDFQKIVNADMVSQEQSLLAIKLLASTGDFSCLDRLKALLAKSPDWSIETFGPGGSMAGCASGGSGGGNAGSNSKYPPRGRYIEFLWEFTGQNGFDAAMTKLVPQMEALLHSKGVWARQDAAYILSRIASPAAMKALNQVALHDADPDVRSYAEFGLRSLRRRR